MDNKMSKARKQELFNKAVAGLASQGFEASVDTDGTCQYRGPNGKRCAVGWLISDASYSPEMEGKTPEKSGYKAAAAMFEALFPSAAERTFLTNLQACHDRAFNSAANEAVAVAMVKNLDAFARLHDLVIPPELTSPL